MSLSITQMTAVRGERVGLSPRARVAAGPRALRVRSYLTEQAPPSVETVSGGHGETIRMGINGASVAQSTSVRRHAHADDASPACGAVCANFPGRVWTQGLAASGAW